MTPAAVFGLFQAGPSSLGEAMLGYTRNHLLVLLAAIVCVMTITSLLLMYFIPAPPSRFSIATGGEPPNL